jgi:hypothetical protein
MDWQFVIVLVIAIPIILFPAVFIWYINAAGLYTAIKERGAFRIFAPFLRAARIGLAIIVPLGIYGAVIWQTFVHFGWQVALALALVMPIILFVPVLIWVAVVSGLYQVALARVRQRTAVRRRGARRLTEESVISR